MHLATFSPSVSAQRDSLTQTASYALAIARALEKRGIDSREVFRQVGLVDVLTNDPLQRFSVERFNALFKRCTEVTGDPYFGLTVGQLMHVANLHALGYALMASATLGDFCGRLVRFYRILSTRAQIEFVKAQWEASLRLNVLARCDESEDAWQSFLIRFMRLLHREDFKPLRVELCRPRPAEGEGPYLEFFGAPVTFDNAQSVLVFDRSDLEIPLKGACPDLAQLNDNIAADYVAKLDRSDIVARTRAQIIGLLPSGRCSLTETARALGMAVPTLKFKLGERDTSFQHLLNEMREEFAHSYLRQPNLSITEITFLLGFTDVSNFTRAFKRWTGVSPSSYRRSA